MTKYKFFTGPDCSGCKVLKDALTPQQRERLQIVDVSTREGAQLARVFNVRSLPTIIGRDNMMHIGLQACSAFVKSLT